eukprot:6234575-Pyramimonas_sp.AAC.1
MFHRGRRQGPTPVPPPFKGGAFVLEVDGDGDDDGDVGDDDGGGGGSMGALTCYARAPSGSNIAC